MRRSLAVLLTAVGVLTACSSHPAGPHSVGDESFVSPAPGGSGFGRAAPMADAAGAPAAAAGEAGRAVEEPDIYALAGGMLYVLNAYRGLEILDVSDSVHPQLAGRVAVEGRPVDLYLRGTTAFVAVAGTFRFVAVAGGDSSAPLPEAGSRLLAVDVASPAAPAVLADLAIEGDLDQTRIVGNVLYAVSHPLSYAVTSAGVATSSGAAGGGIAFPSGGAGSIEVASFDLSDPRAIRAVDRKDFDSVGWDTHANVTSSRITLSQSGWDASGAVTRFQAIDVSDPGGALALGASFSSPGTVPDRWAMDFDPGTGLFRAVLATGWSSGATLRVWSSPAPGAASEVGHLDLAMPESLTAARFDGARAYLTTAVQTDPLFVVDTTDPQSPKLLGEVQMPGRLDFVEPRGDRLLALGHQTGNDGAWELTVTLLDVTDPAAPFEKSRVAFGSSWSWIGAAPDDLRKAFQVLDALGLILVPVQGWDATRWSYAGGTQLVDWGDDALALRGFLPHAGAITRAFVLDPATARLGALSDESLQTVDASDRDHPVELASLDLARSVSAVALVEGKAIELAGDWYRGATEIAVTEPLDPDAPVPLARVAVAAPYARMFQDGDVVWLLAEDWRAGSSWVQAVDLSNPARPTLRGRLDLAQGLAGSWFGGGFGAGDQAVQVGHALVLHPATRFGPLLAAAAAPGCTGCSSDDALTAIDLSDPDHPSAVQVALPASEWSWGLAAAGSYAWMSHAEWFDEPQGLVRYYLDRVDLADPRNPVLLPKVNVPGVFFAADPGGTRIYTEEAIWSPGALSAITWVHALDLTSDGKARLAASVSVDGSPGGAAVAAGRAYLELWTEAAAMTADPMGASVSASVPTGRLAALDLAAMAVTSVQEVDAGWAWPIAALGGKLFLAAGGSGEGVLVYDLGDPGRPAFDRFVRTQGWVEDVAVGNGLAYLACGPYGVDTVPLSP